MSSTVDALEQVLHAAYRPIVKRKRGNQRVRQTCQTLKSRVSPHHAEKEKGTPGGFDEILDLFCVAKHHGWQSGGAGRSESRKTARRRKKKIRKTP